jgi:hypothetical protein
MLTHYMEFRRNTLYNTSFFIVCPLLVRSNRKTFKISQHHRLSTISQLFRLRTSTRNTRFKFRLLLPSLYPLNLLGYTHHIDHSRIHHEIIINITCALKLQLLLVLWSYIYLLTTILYNIIFICYSEHVQAKFITTAPQHSKVDQVWINLCRPISPTKQYGRLQFPIHGDSSIFSGVGKKHLMNKNESVLDKMNILEAESPRRSILKSTILPEDYMPHVA